MDQAYKLKWWNKETTLNLSMLVFWDVMPGGLVGNPEDGDSTFFQNTATYLPTSPRGVTTQKTNTDITTTMSTPNLTRFIFQRYSV
jgi:hypothetical protein